MIEPRHTLREMVRHVARDPIRFFVIEWNWKSALMSSICRATLFLIVNLPAGLIPGLRAMLTEFVFRGTVSGVLGSLTQAFSRAKHPWVALLLLPTLGHTAEFLVHRAAGTPLLAKSIAASVAFSMLTTAFNLFAMRRGVLVVGADEQSLRADLRRLPGLIAAFLLAFCLAAVRGPASAWRALRRRRDVRKNHPAVFPL
jgi:hypothetical protein